MTATDTEAMTAVRALLDERQRYEGWIKGLDTRRETVAPHVYDRVRGDYGTRLAGVIERLTEHAEQLRSTVDVLASRLRGLREREADRQEARQEGELRAAVGEYGDEEWVKLRDDADLEIALIAEEREGVEKELDELQRIMQLTSAPPEPTTSATAATSDRGEDASSSASAESNATRPAAETATGNGAAAGSRSPVLAAKPGDESGQSIEDFVADWPVQHVADGSATVHVTQGNGATSGDSAQRRVQPAKQEKTSHVAPLLSAPPLEGQAASEPATEMRREQEKTLKCPECGALNYATEWYCERCGGELATY